MKKKLVFFIIGFVIVSVASLILMVKGKPTAKNLNALGSFSQAELAKITVSNPPDSITLEQLDTGWEITAPVKDWADIPNLERLWTQLQKMEIGSIVSENPSKYPQFQLDEGNADQIQVFSKNKSEAIFNGFFGKAAQGYGTLYFRFEGKDPVHIVNDFPNYLLNRAAKDYRLKALIPADFETVSHIKIKGEKVDLSIAYSSPTWTHNADGSSIENAWAETLKTRVKNLNSYNFGVGDEPDQITGFSKPHLELEVQDQTKTYKAVIGKNVPKVSESDVDQRFGKLDGREAILYIYLSNTTDLLSHLETLKK